MGEMLTADTSDLSDSKGVEKPFSPISVGRGGEIDGATGSS